MKYIYRITFPNDKIYIGKSTMPVVDKKKFYERSSISPDTNRLVVNAIKKYGFDNIEFDIIESSEQWTDEQLNIKEKKYISEMNSHCENGKGYNMTAGGDGLDSKTAKKYATSYHENLTDEQKKKRSENCSKGQLKRFKNNPDSQETRDKKSKSHQGHYLIESPDGKKWETKDGLKKFAAEYKEDLGVSYWSLFNAYRKAYNNQQEKRKRKDSNYWKVTRLDK